MRPTRGRARPARARGRCGVKGCTVRHPSVASITSERWKKIRRPPVVPVSMVDSSHDVREEIAALLPRLRRFGRTLAQRREDADDLVQIAVEKALTRTDQWTPGTRLGSWMFRIMQNTWID